MIQVQPSTTLRLSCHTESCLHLRIIQAACKLPLKSSCSSLPSRIALPRSIPAFVVSMLKALNSEQPIRKVRAIRGQLVLAGYSNYGDTQPIQDQRSYKTCVTIVTAKPGEVLCRNKTADSKSISTDWHRCASLVDRIKSNMQIKVHCMQTVRSRRELLPLQLEVTLSL